ncbi:MAG TPA: hypothetical protein VLQ93_20885, partial [Myxococcaceae bacterium]|nr:hypothetical protein [Myxococcaceae bacterium]
MKVNGRDEAAPARPAPDKGRFQQALQRTGKGKEAGKGPGRPGALPPAPGAQRPGTPSAPPRVSAGAGPTRLLPTGTQVAAGPARLFAGGSFASAEHLGQVRQKLQVEVHRLQEVRSESHQVSQERGEQRMTELLSRELARELRAEPAPRSTPHPPGPEPTASPAPQEATSALEETRAGGAGRAPLELRDTKSPEARLQATLELVERIEVFVKSQRPALSLKLGGALDATVEV